MYNSPRVTHDIDIAIRTLDIDIVINLMYENDFYLVSDVDNDSAIVELSSENTKKWVEKSKSGSMTFIGFNDPPKNNRVSLAEIDITTQVDYLFELSVPIVKLRERAKKIEVDNFTVYVASADDLLILKENQKDKNSADYADIQFLRNLINNKGLPS